MLSIRLSAAESEALTLLRATYEIQTLDRISIKGLIKRMIADALERKLAGKLVLPMEKTTPIIGRNQHNEHLLIEKSEDDKAALKSLSVGADGVMLPYGHGDIVREIIQMDVRAIKAAHIARKIAHGPKS
jgi:3-dehydroquinate synthase class II